ncbi:MAG: hypothetical protein IPQ00_03050 [Chloracidobacterium sp.]|nr:hypothetical protein [Chloracidobacterium sp.]
MFEGILGRLEQPLCGAAPICELGGVSILLDFVPRMSVVLTLVPLL